MTTITILAMHGAPPLDFPPTELAEFFNLHTRFERTSQDPKYPGQDSHTRKLIDRYLELDSKMCYWPRTRGNDPFYAASMDMARSLSNELGHEVIVGFNEFCAPTLDEAFEKAASLDPVKVIVITPMMTRGGEHAEKDIPQAVELAKQRYPNITFIYAWPFEEQDITRFLSDHVRNFYKP